MKKIVIYSVLGAIGLGAFMSGIYLSTRTEVLGVIIGIAGSMLMATMSFLLTQATAPPSSR